MANYSIIGGDGKEYHLVSGDDLRKWIAEGRLNAHSLAKADGEAQFRPLSTFPEFADALAAGPAAPPAPLAGPHGDGRELASQEVKGPAIALIVTASLGIIYYLFNAIFCLAGGGMMFQSHMGGNVSPQMQQWIDNMRGPGAAAVSVLIAAVQGLVLFGAVKLLRLQSYALVMTAVIIAMLPCIGCCCILGLPFGVWALIVINKPEVKSQFT